ncbi:DNA-binding protein [Deinococcus marmoris]|uniref:KfrA N-terminal DNA-binding domain-containing protein n=1 Tax=Deinococcus marmoris TaxID=249408 RepID=A0A1U7NUT2_9DEIO|nr:DNA-binding protein [Deinococcus marmoris]OLV16683.1 hypothetical protein BOO71_0011074 [Deinococcus marmoris]
MARKSVTKEDVARASQTLRDRGDRVTLMAVCQELGCGSFTTLKPLIADWLAEHPEP